MSERHDAADEYAEDEGPDMATMHHALSRHFNIAASQIERAFPESRAAGLREHFNEMRAVQNDVRDSNRVLVLSVCFATFAAVDLVALSGLLLLAAPAALVMGGVGLCGRFSAWRRTSRNEALFKADMSEYLKPPTAQP